VTGRGRPPNSTASDPSIRLGSYGILIGMTDLQKWLPSVLESHQRWMDQFGAFAEHPSLQVDDDAIAEALGRLTERLGDNYPYGHPRYVAQMLKPPHPVAVIGYLSAMLLNPNNHALDAGPATAQMEREVVDDLARMFRLPQHMGHLTSSGTIANLEGLWVARELHPGKAIAFSADAHYTHSRMCALLGVRGISVPTDSAGRMDPDALAAVLAQGEVGTVVATVGTTGLGALDPLRDIVDLAKRYGVRVHVDTAYGGFFALIADDSPAGVARSPFETIAEVDSVVVDPHKHGLQPYGCGAVLFADPSVGRFYKHDSPYTYFSSQELHLGEISLECSRAGAAAAALWLTLQVLPLSTDGLGAVLNATRRGALRWAGLLEKSDVFTLFQPPELDIVAFLPRRQSMSAIDSASSDLFRRAGALAPSEQVHVATYTVNGSALQSRGHDVALDQDTARIVRSTVMKPESADAVDEIHARLEILARQQ